MNENITDPPTPFWLCLLRLLNVVSYQYVLFVAGEIGNNQVLTSNPTPSPGATTTSTTVSPTATPTKVRIYFIDFTIYVNRDGCWK